MVGQRGVYRTDLAGRRTVSANVAGTSINQYANNVVRIPHVVKFLCEPHTQASNKSSPQTANPSRRTEYTRPLVWAQGHASTLVFPSMENEDEIQFL